MRFGNKLISFVVLYNVEFTWIDFEVSLYMIDNFDNDFDYC